MIFRERPVLGGRVSRSHGRLRLSRGVGELRKRAVAQSEAKLLRTSSHMSHEKRDPGCFWFIGGYTTFCCKVYYILS